MSIILKKPLSLLDRNINLDTKSLTKTVVKIVAKTVSLKWDEAFEEAPEVLDALGLIQSEEEIAANSNMRCDSFKSLMIINKLSKFL